MSLFVEQFNAAQKARVAVALESESIATESLAAEVAAEEGDLDQFADERAELNQQLDEIMSQIETGEVATEGLEGEAVVTAEAEAAAAIEQAEAALSQEAGEAAAAVEQVEDAGVEQLDKPGGDNIGEDIDVVPPAGTPEVDGKPVEDIDDSGDVDYEDEADVVAVEAALEELATESVAMESLEAEIDMLNDSVIAIESFGINPTAAVIMKATGLLAGTALDAIALEAYAYHGPKDAESELACEALGGKIKEKAAAWAAKIVSMAKGFGEKVMGVLTPIWNKLSEGVKSLAGMAWDKTKAAAAYAKAHPYKTVLGAIAAIALVAGVVAFATGGMPGATAKAADLKKYLGGVADKIKGIAPKWEFGKVTAVVNEAGSKIKVSVSSAGAAVKSASVDALGWTQAGAKALQGQLGRAWTAVASSTKAFGTKAASLAGAAGNTVKDVAGNAGAGAAAKAGSVAEKAKTAGRGIKAFGKATGEATSSMMNHTYAVADTAAKSMGGSNTAHFFGGVIGGIMQSGLVYGLMLVVVSVVSACFRIIASTVRAIKSALGGGKQEAAA